MGLDLDRYYEMCVVKHFTGTKAVISFRLFFAPIVTGFYGRLKNIEVQQQSMLSRQLCVSGTETDGRQHTLLFIIVYESYKHFCTYQLPRGICCVNNSEKNCAGAGSTKQVHKN